VTPDFSYPSIDKQPQSLNLYAKLLIISIFCYVTTFYILHISIAADSETYVFDKNTSTETIKGLCSSDQLDFSHISSNDSKGISKINPLSDNEILKFGEPGALSKSEKYSSNHSIDLKEKIRSAVEPNNKDILTLARIIVADLSGERNIDQICRIYDYLKKGNVSVQGWDYVPDPRSGYYSPAHHTYEIGLIIRELVIVMILPS
jgi:hypothetical protein